MEAWARIEDFPKYLINTSGTIINTRTQEPIKWALARYGIPTVGLYREGKLYRRSVSLLVAKTFLPEPMRYDFITPIHLDGDRGNCYVKNLMWRPRWFAIDFHQQRKISPYPKWRRPFVIVDTEEIFSTPYDCAGVMGVLERGIVNSIWHEKYIFPYGFRASFF